MQRIYDGRQGEVVLHLRQPGRSLLLLLAAGTPAARIHLVTREPAHPERPTPFVGLLRKHLVGSRLGPVEPIPGDRVVVVELARYLVDEGGGAQSLEFRLVAELTGRHGNLFLVDGQGVILGSLRANVSHRRKLVPGEPYIPPSRPAELPVGSALRWTGPTTGSLSQRVETLFDDELARQEELRQRTDQRTAFKRVHERLTRRLRHVGEDLARADRSDQLIRWGQLLQSAYGKVAKGADSAQVPDYFHPDLRAVEIPLDPALSLGDNIARYFKDGRRLKEARAMIQRRMEETRALLDQVDQALAVLEAPGVEQPDGLAEVHGSRETPGAGTDLGTLWAELASHGLVGQKRQGPARVGRDRPFALPYTEFESADGNAILVGRGARHNDQLTFRVARGHDLWLHASGTTGAHVIVCLGKTEELKPETLVDAATLAVYHSGLKGEKVAEVRYTWQRNVKKTRGSAPGQVSVAQSKVLAVRREPDRIRRLLASRKQESVPR